MSVVNFSVAAPLAREINQIIKKDGFASKAEFFRFAVKNYIDKRHQASNMSIDERFEKEMNEFAEFAARKLRGRKLPSPEEQLADL